MKPALLAFFLLLTTGSANADKSTLVAVASSLRQVWPELMKHYPAANGIRVTFGSSGNLARQIAQGAPFTLFLSADEQYPQWLIEQGITSQRPTIYASGRLAWVALPQSTLGDWIQAKNNETKQAIPIPDNLKRLAIANPAFAPYGRAALTVLDSMGIANTVELSLGENAMQALQFTLSGATDGGIVPLSLVNESVKEKLPSLQIAEIATDQHQQLIHAMLLIGEPSAGSQSLFDYLLSAQAQSILSTNGFQVEP